MAEVSGLAMHLVHLRCLQHLNSQRHSKQQRNEEHQTSHEALHQPPQCPAPPAQQGSGALLPARPPHAPSSDHSGMVSAPHQKRHKPCPFIQPPLIFTALVSDVEKSTGSDCTAAPSPTAVPACVASLSGAHTPSHEPPTPAGAAASACASSPPAAGSQETNAGGWEEEAAGEARQSQGDKSGDSKGDDTGDHRGDGLLDVLPAPSAPRSAGQEPACDTEEGNEERHDEMRRVQGDENASGGEWCGEEGQGETGDWSFIDRIRRQEAGSSGGGGVRGRGSGSGGGGGGGGGGIQRAGGGQQSAQGETGEETEDEDRDSRQPTTFLHV